MLALLSHGGVPFASSDSQLNATSGVLAAASASALVFWRRAPFATFVLVAVLSAFSAALGSVFGIPLMAPVALYLAAAARDDARLSTRASGASVVALFAAYVAAATASNGAPPTGELLHVVLAWAVAWFAGERTRLRREHVADLERRAARAERDAERERELAAAEERARIARDLHDSAGHAINVIAVTAGAARLHHAQNPTGSGVALTTIEQVARETAAEIDAIVGALREDCAPDLTAKAPSSLASLGTLLDRHASVGLDVTIDTRGRARSLERPVDLAAYRILQEALTNATRHGTGRAQVELAFDDDALVLTVANPIDNRRPVGADRGHGIIGMRERVALLNGRLDISRCDDAFRLRARLPYRRAVA